MTQKFQTLTSIQLKRNSPSNTCHFKSSNRAIFYIVFLFVLNQLLVLVSADDFYSLLGVAQDAETSQIKKAFRQKSLELHPDKNPGKLYSS